MALLQNNACLSCHAIDHKVVGPAYHDVAAKYAKDPQALAKVIASIQNGGTGKWGNVPMPPFAQLSPDDLKTLATFVLHQ
ncbi:Cytochrome c-551 [compost metagenome]